MPIRKGPLTIRAAHLFIEKTVTDAETKFLLLHGRSPSLVEERDYVLLADFLNIPDIDCKNRYLQKFEGNAAYRYPAIPGHDVAYVLLRHFLERQGFFVRHKKVERTILFGGMMGRLSYNVPSEEYAYRLERLARLQMLGIPFPSDFAQLMQTIEQVSWACFLPTIYQKVCHEPESEATKKGYLFVGSCMVNPAKSYLQLLWFLDTHEYGSFINLWSMFRDSTTNTNWAYR